jgi:hypothetical protein
VLVSSGLTGRLLGGLESQPVIHMMLQQAQRRLRLGLPKGPGIFRRTSLHLACGARGGA